MEEPGAPREGATALTVAVVVVHGLVGLSLGLLALALLGVQSVYGAESGRPAAQAAITTGAVVVTGVSFPVCGWLGVRAFRRGAATARWVLLLALPFAVLCLGVLAALLGSRLGG